MNKRSKILYALAAVAILTFIGKDTYDEYIAIKSVKYKIENIHIDSSNDGQKEIKVDLTISFYNPSDLEFNLKNLQLDVLNDSKMVLGEIEKANIKIEPQTTKTSVSLTIKSDDISVNLGKLFSKREVFIYILGNVTYKAGIMGIPIDVEINEPLNVKDELLKLLRKKVGL